jgi:Smg protein
MFDILVYLYETYYRPDACPEPEALARKLSAVGFDDVEISEALVWLTDLTAMAGVEQALTAASTGTRFYVDEEQDVLGTAAIGFIQFLESAKVLTPLQREIVVERALALDEVPVSLAKLKVIVLMLLWSQGKEPDALMFDDLFGADEDQAPRLLH